MKVKYKVAKIRVAVFYTGKVIGQYNHSYMQFCKKKTELKV